MFHKSVVKVRRLIKMKRVAFIISIFATMVGIIILSAVNMHRSNFGILDGVCNNFINGINCKN